MENRNKRKRKKDEEKRKIQAKASQGELLSGFSAAEKSRRSCDRQYSFSCRSALFDPRFEKNDKRLISVEERVGAV